MRRRVALGLVVVAGLMAAVVAEEAIRTLFILRRVEDQRDAWQRPDAVLRELDLHPGMRVVDLGSGAGYFALKMAALVAPRGQVLAIDLRRESLAFLWARAQLAGRGNVEVIVGATDDPRLPSSTPVDAVLIANTFHELTAPAPVLVALSRATRPRGRLVVVDRGRRDGAAAGEAHEMSATEAEHVITASGFQLVRRDERFIDREEDVWWMMTFQRP